MTAPHILILVVIHVVLLRLVLISQIDYKLVAIIFGLWTELIQITIFTFSLLAATILIHEGKLHLWNLLLIEPRRVLLIDLVALQISLIHHNHHLISNGARIAKALI